MIFISLSITPVWGIEHIQIAHRCIYVAPFHCISVVPVNFLYNKPYKKKKSIPLYSGQRKGVSCIRHPTPQSYIPWISTKALELWDSSWRSSRNSRQGTKMQITMCSPSDWDRSKAAAHIVAPRTQIGLVVNNSITIPSDKNNHIVVPMKVVSLAMLQWDG